MSLCQLTMADLPINILNLNHITADCVPVCGHGTYSPTGLVPCLECPRNSYTGEPPVGGHKDCEACPPSMFTYQPAAPARSFCRGETKTIHIFFHHNVISHITSQIPCSNQLLCRSRTQNSAVICLIVTRLRCVIDMR